MLDDLFQPARPARDVAARRTYVAAGVYGIFAIGRLIAWSHVGVALHWVMVVLGAALTAKLWRAFLATCKIDPRFGERGHISNFVMIPLIVGVVMTAGDAWRAAKEML